MTNTPQESRRFPRSSAALLLGGCLLLAGPPLNAQDEAELAKQTQNPLSSLVSVPFQNNTLFGIGPDDALVNLLNVQPVYPLNLGKWNLISRAILPLVYQDEIIPGTGSEFGLGDLNYTAFFSPAKPAKWTWGVGPAFVLPTATEDRLGSEKWSGGGSVVVLTMPGRWVIGLLFSNVWSFAGEDDRADVNQFLFQYFINYNLDKGWYLTSGPINTANWEADSDNRWTTPVGGGFGRVFAIGKQHVNVQFQTFYNVEHPEGGADWSTRFQFQLLFPKK